MRNWTALALLLLFIAIVTAAVVQLLRAAAL